MRLDLDKNLLDLRGNPQDKKLYEILADILATSSTQRPAQTIAWAYDLIKNGKIEITRQDADFISGLVKKNQTFIDLAKAQILEEINKLKE